MADQESQVDPHHTSLVHERIFSDLEIQTISKNEVISELESRYIRLLERKIDQLESELGDRSKRATNDETTNNQSVGEQADDKPSMNETTDTKHDSEQKEEKKNCEDDEVESRYEMIISTWNREKGEFDEKSQDRKESTTYGPQPKSNKAFTFRKIIFSAVDKDLTSSEFDIVSEPLQELLGRLTSKWGWADKVTKCQSPYLPLIYSWEIASKEANAIVEEDSPDIKQARDDLGEMLKLISTSSGHVKLDRYFKERDTFLNESTITHDSLCTIFPPGTLILGRPCYDEKQVFFVESCDGFIADNEDFEVTCFSFDWNGSKFNRVPFSMGIKSWGGDRKRITELPFYPLKYYTDGKANSSDAVEELKETLIKRGIKYKKLCTAQKGRQMFNYSEGVAYFHGNGSFLEQKARGQEQESRSSSISDQMQASAGSVGSLWKRTAGAMIVDFSSYIMYQPANTPILGSLNRYDGDVADFSFERRSNPVFKAIYRFDWDEVPADRELTPDQLLCCPPRVLGYALKQKTWVQLLVDNLHHPKEADNNTFKNKLQLRKDYKDLISKSVKAHEEAKKTENGQSKGLEDFAPEKGRGLVIMLYGEPGVGKTLTAESVAQMTGKPLFSVGVSDIGIEGDKVESNLQKVFALAGLWEAVLLFDEADVFLEARGEGDNDIRRNAMVSVLLRVLEYYDGILILTTNRMRSLDIAVQSRIHLAIKFEELTEDQKQSIFKSFLDQLANKGLIENYKTIKEWVEETGQRENFNGRQIRNAISTALGIALADGRRLERNDLSKVSRQTSEFKKNLADQEAIYRSRQIDRGRN